jgi:hypothetical protein
VFDRSTFFILKLLLTFTCVHCKTSTFPHTQELESNNSRSNMPLTQPGLAGATASLGATLLKALLSADCSVTVLSRVGGNSSRLKAHPNIVIKEVDFNTVRSLTSASVGNEVVVCCLATLARGRQNPLIDASVAVGVKRFVLAELGRYSGNLFGQQVPVCVPRVTT